MVFGLAPGYEACTTIVGGTTSGYSLMGNRHMAINPTMKTRVESTPANIGRRMKKCEKFIRLPPCYPRPFAARHLLLRSHRHSRADPLEPVDNNLISRLEPGTDNAFTLQPRPKGYGPVLDGVCWRESHDKFFALVSPNSAFRHQQRGMALAQWDANAREKTRNYASVL